VKTLYPAVGLQSVSEETCVYIADLNVSNLWQAENTLSSTVPAQSNDDTLFPTDAPVIHKIFSYAKIVCSTLVLM